MKLSGKTNKVLAGLSPAKRYGFDYHGDIYNREVAGIVALVRSAVALEEGEDVELGMANERWAIVWNELQRQLRTAAGLNDGAFLHLLADHFRPPVDPVRAWIDALFLAPTVNPENLTSEQLYQLYKRESAKPHTAFDGFTKVLRELGVNWDKPKRKKRRRL